MFPIRDENPRSHWPIVTVAFIALNAASWVLLQGLGQPQALGQSICELGLIPGDLLGSARGRSVPLGQVAVCVLDGEGVAWTPFTSMFLHGGWFHILGNLWFLWLFGDNVEDVMGVPRFVLFYLLCGLAAAAAQVASDPHSTVPMVGASGAISGVMGAYARLYPRARIDTLVILGFYVTTVSLPAVVMLGYWFLIQVLGGLPALAGVEGGVAFWAHVGGFVAGVALMDLFVSRRRLAERRVRLPRSIARHRWL